MIIFLSIELSLSLTVHLFKGALSLLIRQMSLQRKDCSHLSSRLIKFYISEEYLAIPSSLRLVFCMSLNAFLSPSILRSLSPRAGLTWGSSRRWNLLLEFLSFCNNSNNLPAFAAQTFDVCYLTTQRKNESELWPVFLAFWCSGRRCVWRRTRNFMAPERSILRTANTDCQENDRLFFLNSFYGDENHVPKFGYFEGQVSS